MGAVDKAKHEGQDLLGKAKEEIGDVTDNHSLQAQGVADQLKAGAGKVGDEARDELRGRNDDGAEERSSR
jgi:uncharacterized protein YjbJ (UPF0337 family)